MGNNQNKHKRRATSQMNLLLRMIFAGYLLYLAFDLRGHFGEIVYSIAIVVFAVVGVALMVNSIKRMFGGDYDLVDSNGEIIEPDDLPEETTQETTEEVSDDEPEGE